jgi:hypothetical protein
VPSIEPGTGQQIEQAIDLGKMAFEAPGQFGLADPLGAHGGVQSELCFCYLQIEAVFIDLARLTIL